MKNDMTDNQEMKRLAWACRRGMLELDLIFIRFLEQAYPALSPSDQALFKEFLKETDPDIYSWLLGSSQPSESRFLPLISKIQAHANITIQAKAL